MKLKVIGIDKLIGRIKELKTDIGWTVVDAINDSAITIRDRWISDAIELKLDDKYVASIDITNEPPRGKYVGPTKTFALTQRGLVDIEDIQEGDYITYTARCSIHKYHREVKRETQPSELNAFFKPEMLVKFEEYKEIIRDIIKEKLRSLMRGGY